ncbi:Endonuclease/exonuclease/phosphatase [Amanita rubescens]|nr:Endonuclease/exonuclease/phosphatase [Amanita rubescens]
MPNMTAPVIPNLLIKSNAYRYRAAIKGWKHIHLDKVDDSKCPSYVRIITWNINYDALAVVERLDAALRHLEMDILGCKEGETPEPCCILLQELNATAFSHLLANSVGPSTFCHHTEIARKVAWQCHSSIYQRTGVIVDIRLNDPAKDADGSRGSTSVIRVINTHLESLPRGLTARRMQLDVLSKLLFVGGERCGGVIAGDMNAIGPNEHEYPAELGLRDAWNKSEDTKEGHTWGYQGPSQYPAGRLDKVLYLPLDEYEVDTPERVGMGVIVKNLESGDSMPQFVSDHYGLDTTLRMIA